MVTLAERSRRPVVVWLYIGVGMLFVQVVLGGITRLTGSGLSITEWNVVTGFLPPLTQTQWITAFEKYKQTPQYLLLNTDFKLPDFKFIFFWEWLHRFWARLIGIVFIIPFVIFLLQKRFKPEMIRPLIILFLLGALQGAIGWIMVLSGLTGDAIYVKPTRLALHFIFALLLISYAFWFALKLSVPPKQKIVNRALRLWTKAILIILFFQLSYGALMAGHKAATAAPDWPLINGSWIPDFMFKTGTGSSSLIGNKITIHFIHRCLAYLLVACTLVWTVKAIRVQPGSDHFNKTKWLPAVLIIGQVLLGILSLLTSTSIVPHRWGSFEWLAQWHQITGMSYLLVMVWMLYLSKCANVLKFGPHETSASRYILFFPCAVGFASF